MKGAAAVTLLAVLGLALALSSSADAETFTADGVEYTMLDDGTLSVTGGDVSDLVVTGSVTLDGAEYRVSGIGEGAFQFSDSLRTVRVSGDVDIMDYAFSNCANLREAVIGEGVSSMGIGAFFYCASLETASLPSTLTGLGEMSFAMCRSLREIAVAEGNPVLEVVDGALVDRSEFGHLSVMPAKNGVTEFTVPDGIMMIDAYAFEGCAGLTSVTVPDSVVSIGDMAFMSCSSLETVSLPAELSRIGSLAFGYCTSLVSVEVPLCPEYPGSMFSGCGSLRHVTLPDGMSAISPSMFIGCYSLMDVSLPSTVTDIGDYAFSECTSLTSVAIPSGVMSVGAGAFSNCSNLQEFLVEGEGGRYSSSDGVLMDTEERTLVQYPCGRDDEVYGVPEGTLFIGDDAFSGCPYLKGVHLPEGLTVIRSGAFSFCGNLEYVTLPDSLTAIDLMAFYRCSSLQHVTIPGGVASIGNSAFSGCSSLTSIDADLTNTRFTSVDGVLYTSDMSELVQFPGGREQSVLVVPATVTTVREGALSYCFGLMAVDVEDGNLSYSSEGGVLMDLERTTVLIVPSGKVGEYRVPDSVRLIESGALAGCYDVSLIFYTTGVEFGYGSLNVGDAARGATLHISAPPGFEVPGYASNSYTRVVLDTGGGMDETLTIVIGIAVSVFAIASAALLFGRRP